MLNKKSIRPEDELSDALEEIARDIALIEPDPQDWGGWVMLFIDQLEDESDIRVVGFTYRGYFLGHTDLLSCCMLA